MPSTRQQLNRLLQEYSLASRQFKQEKAVLQEAQEHLQALQEAQELTQGAAEQVQASAHQQIAGVVSRCLETVFEEDAYEFLIQFEKKRGRTEASLLFRREGTGLLDPISSSGGGTVDVAAFALRLACLVLELPRRRKLLVLDEPLRFLSGNYLPRAKQLFVELSKEMGLQIIMVTHSMGLACGKTVHIGE